MELWKAAVVILAIQIGCLGPASSKVLELPGGRRLSYDVVSPQASASATPVAFCLPGMGDSRQSYRFLAPRLVAAGMRVISADLRGTGGSSTNFLSYTVPQVARDVIAILDQENIQEPVTILGNSFSAAVAVFLSVRRRERVRALVGLSGFYRDMPSDAYFRPLSHLLFTRGYGTAFWLSYFKSLFVMPPPDFAAYIAAMKANMNANPKRAVIIGKFARAPKAAAWAAAANVSRPVLLLLGERDPDFKDRAAELETVRSRVAQGGPPALVAKLVPAAGPYPQAEQPEWVGVEVVAFLRSAGILP